MEAEGFADEDAGARDHSVLSDGGDSSSESGDDSDSIYSEEDSSDTDDDASESSDEPSDDDASADDASDDSDSEQAAKAKRKRCKSKVYERLNVELRNSDRVHTEAAKRNMSTSALARIIKAYIMVEGGDTEGERANAERALSTLLRAHTLERADVAALAKPVADAELLQNGAEVRCFGQGLKSCGWTTSVGSACSMLYNTKYYLLGRRDFVFYGESANAMACAQLFAELYPAVLQMTDEYMASRARRPGGSATHGLSARASHLHGLSDGFLQLARVVAEQRKEYVKKNIAEAEFQRAAIAERAAEVAEKRRIQRLAAMQAVNETLAAVADGATDAAGDGAGPSAETAGASAATGGAAAPAEDDEKAESCAICWEPMKKGGAFITNACGHAFHVACQMTAIRARLTTCGLCRAPLALIYSETPANTGGSASSSDEEMSSDDSSDAEDESSSDDDAGGSPAYGAASDDEDDVVLVADYTAEEAAMARRAASEVLDLTDEQVEAHAEAVKAKHTEALTLALADERNADIAKAMQKKVFPASFFKKDGTMKAGCMLKHKRTARDADAYHAGKEASKKLKMCNALELYM